MDALAERWVEFWADGWVDVGFGSVGSGRAWLSGVIVFCVYVLAAVFKVLHIQHPYNIIQHPSNIHTTSIQHAHFCTQVRAGREKYFFQLIMLYGY